MTQQQAPATVGATSWTSSIWPDSATNRNSVARSVRSPRSRPASRSSRSCTGAFQLFFFAFSIADPPFWWTWLIALGGQMLFALCFAELSTHYPMAGSVYNWAKHVGGRTASWLAGFSLTLALIVSTGGGRPGDAVRVADDLRRRSGSTATAPAPTTRRPTG